MNKTTFTKDFAAKTLTAEHEFDAPRKKVWQAWTDGSILEKWWGPKTWPATSKKMDFREGGYWHYYMTGPDGTKSWGRIDYLTIDPERSFTGEDSFCDEAGNKNPELPGMHWRVEFQEKGEKTKVVVVTTFKSEADMKKIIEMGVEEGFGDALDNLDRIFASAK